MEEKEKNKSLAKYSQEDAIDIDTDSAQKKLKAIKEFQAIVQKELHEGHDYGVIPGTQKPTLLKPGAEKIAKLLNLADEYEIEDKTENWEKPFFYYRIKCRLRSLSSGQIVSEGLGSCNSMESRYRWRWIFESDLSDYQRERKDSLVRSERTARKTGKPYVVYRVENDEIWTLNNTILKIAKKRALVDASLSAGRLSDLFTQDVEDIANDVMTKQNEAKPRAEKTEAREENFSLSQEEEILPNKPIKREQVKVIMNLMNTLVDKFGKKPDWIHDDIFKKVETVFDVKVKNIPDDLTQVQAERVITDLKNKIDYLMKKKDEEVQNARL